MYKAETKDTGRKLAMRHWQSAQSQTVNNSSYPYEFNGIHVEAVYIVR